MNRAVKGEEWKKASDLIVVTSLPALLTQDSKQVLERSSKRDVGRILTTGQVRFRKYRGERNSHVMVRES